MKGNFLEDMLLINDVATFKLFKEMQSLCFYLLGPTFLVALVIEYFGNMDFLSVCKRLIIITVFMSCFHEIHQSATKASLETASDTLKLVSPRNFFIKKWYETKVHTKTSDMSIVEALVIPDLNDLFATALYLLSKIFVVIVKVSYSTTYHFTYIFSSVCGLLYFFGWTNNALKLNIQASLMCIIHPFVFVACLCIVGNQFDEKSLNGDLVVTHIDSIIMLLGATGLLLASISLSWKIVSGEGFIQLASTSAAAFSIAAASRLQRLESPVQTLGGRVRMILSSDDGKRARSNKVSSQINQRRK